MTRRAIHAEMLYRDLRRAIDVYTRNGIALDRANLFAMLDWARRDGMRIFDAYDPIAAESLAPVIDDAIRRILADEFPGEADPS